MDAPVANPLAAVRRNQFPAAFRWGCSTSSYQIEGAAHADGRGASIWDHFCKQAGRIRDGSSGEVACDHYHRWPADLDLARELCTNAYRFSIAWPRIFAQGRGAKPNQAGLDFYARLVDGMLERGLEPWCTLYHWDLPQTLQDAVGGWAHRDTVAAFADYTDVVTRHLGDRVRQWITHNEPWCTSFHGHWEGVHAPGVRNLRTALQVCHHVMLSHGLAVDIVRRNVAGAQVGAALSLHPIRAASTAPSDIDAARRHDGLRNRWFLDPLHGRGYPQDVWDMLGADVPTMSESDLAHIATPTDFLGINYYFPEVVSHDASASPTRSRVIQRAGVERTAFGWEVAPEGLAELLQRVHRDYAPASIFITENGSTYDDRIDADGQIRDDQRQAFLTRHLVTLRDVVQSGIPVHGYFAWSLLDNFEWAEGYTRRFGLTHVDFNTQERRLKLSGQWYKAFLQGVI